MPATTGRPGRRPQRAASVDPRGLTPHGGDDPGSPALVALFKTTTDPGRSLITGLWGDVGKFKGPVLRAVATRAPYFHNGSAKNLAEVIDFYETRFNIGFTHREKADLIAFLRTL